MIRRTRRLVVPARLAVAGIALAAVLGGCSFTNPATIATPYPASDGTASELEDAATGELVRLRNFLVVAPEKGAAGTVAGTVANNGSEPVSVRLTVVDTSDPQSVTPLGETTVDVRPGQVTQVGPGGSTFDLSTVTVAPGTNLTIQAATTSGSTTFPLPVLAATNEYSSLTTTPSATPTTSAPAATPSASPSASAS